MWIGLLWIVGCYGISIAVLHLLYETRKRRAPVAARVLLITHNNQTQIEWYIRSLFFASRIKGRNIAATVLDEGSTDETLRIIERLSYTHTMDVSVSLPEASKDELLQTCEYEGVMVVRLGNGEDLIKIPLFQ